MTNKIYLSGKITDDPDFMQRFADKTEELSSNGDFVFNPAVHPDMFTHGQFMQLDLLALSFCDSIYLMDNWRSSKGANLEFEQAKIMNLKFSFEEPLFTIVNEKGMYFNPETSAFDIDKENLNSSNLFNESEITKINETFFKGDNKTSIVCAEHVLNNDSLAMKSFSFEDYMKTKKNKETFNVELKSETSYRCRITLDDGSKTPWQFFDRKPTQNNYSEIKKYYEELNLKKQKNIPSVKLSEKVPSKTKIGYKVFYLKNGKLYPPMVKNPGGSDTPMGKWLDASAGEIAGTSKTGRPQIEKGGDGTHCSKGLLAYRPGWHLGEVPIAKQFEKINPLNGNKELFPAEFVWCECEYSCDVDYQEEAVQNGMTENGKFRHAYAGLQHLPENGSYRYRTNPDPETEEWIITGKMKVNRILTDKEVDEICLKAGKKPQIREKDKLEEIKKYLQTPPEMRTAYKQSLENKKSIKSKDNDFEETFEY